MTNELIIVDKYINEKKIKEFLANSNLTYIYPINNEDYLKLKNYSNNIIFENEYFDNNSHSYLQELSEKIKNVIRGSLLVTFEKKQIKSLINWISNYYLRKFLNHKIKLIYSLNKIISKYQINKVIYFYNETHNHNLDIIKHLTKVEKILFENYRSVETYNSKKKFFTTPDFVFKLSNFFIKKFKRSYITSKNYRCREVLLEYFKIKEYPILITDSKNLISILNNFFKLNLMTLTVIPKKNTQIYYDLNHNKILNNFPEIVKYDFSDYFSQSFLIFFNKYFCEAVNKCEFIINYFDEHKPNLLLSTDSDYINGFIGEYTSFRNFPSYCLTHGTHTLPKNLNEVIYQKDIGENVIINFYPKIFSQSIFCDEFLNYFDIKSDIIKTLPLVFNIKDISSPKNKTILHASTIKTEESTKFWGVESFQEYLSSLNDMIKLCISLNYKLIIKPHPSFESFAKINDLYSYFNDNNFTVTNESFKKCLNKSDILVSFSSTTIEEALYNHRPVILYDKHNRYSHLDCKNFSKKGEINKKYPYFYFTNFEILKENIDIIYDKHKRKEFEFDWIFKNR